MNNEIMVSVYCATYNHEKYIRQCLEGFVMQKTNFAFEVIVNDDVSTDKTAEIIKEFEQKYPNIIKPIYQTVNQYSQDISIFFEHFLPKAQGRYIAMCEGDDFWTDENKLQKQFDAMEQHPEIDICAHAVRQVNAQTNKEIAIIAPRNEDAIIPVEDVIFGGGGFVGTNSLLLRSERYKNAPSFMRDFTYDYTYQILGSLNAGMLYLADCMSVYNYLTVGSYSDKLRSRTAKDEEYDAQKLAMYDGLNEFTDGKYAHTIEQIKLLNEIDLLSLDNNFRGLFNKKYRPIYKKLTIKRKAAIFIKALFPNATAFIRKYFRRGGVR